MSTAQINRARVQGEPPDPRSSREPGQGEMPQTQPPDASPSTRVGRFPNPTNWPEQARQTFPQRRRTFAFTATALPLLPAWRQAAAAPEGTQCSAQRGPPAPAAWIRAALGAHIHLAGRTGTSAARYRARQVCTKPGAQVSTCSPT